MSKPKHTTTALSGQRLDLKTHWLPFTAGRKLSGTLPTSRDALAAARLARCGLNTETVAGDASC